MNAEGAGPEAGRLDDVGVRFGKVWALRHVSAVIPTGSVVAVVGTNGAGKTSLIRALVGLQPLSEGSISVLGGRLRTDDPADLARIGYVGQRKPLYGYLRVREMLRYGQVTNPGWNSAFAAQRVRDVGIDPDRRIEQLSGGRRTQIALTMALAKQPDLLVLDEPLSDLDPLARQQVLAGLMADVAERGITVVLSSHILGELESTCDSGHGAARGTAGPSRRHRHRHRWACAAHRARRRVGAAVHPGPDHRPPTRGRLHPGVGPPHRRRPVPGPALAKAPGGDGHRRPGLPTLGPV